MLILFFCFTIPTIFANLNLLTNTLCDPACRSCFGANSARHCYECKSNYIWYEGKCTYMESRYVSGYRRPCISCGEYNYPTDDYTCGPCPFPCEGCTNGTNCISCKVELGFQLNNATHLCECIKGYFKDGMCLCQNDSYYVDEVGNCVACQIGTRGLGNCNPPCQLHYYEYTIKDCEPCHYSCMNCTDALESSCIPVINGTEKCNTIEGFEYIPSDNLCLCICDAYESFGTCKCKSGFKETYNATHKMCVKEDT